MKITDLLALLLLVLLIGLFFFGPDKMKNLVSKARGTDQSWFGTDPDAAIAWAQQYNQDHGWQADGSGPTPQGS